MNQLLDTATGKPFPHKGDAASGAALVQILGGNLGGVALTLVDISGTITIGGTAQDLRSAVTASNFLRLANPPSATESLWFCDAVDNAGAEVLAEMGDLHSHELRPGEMFTWPSGILNAVSIIAATSGHKFIARKA